MPYRDPDPEKLRQNLQELVRQLRLQAPADVTAMRGPESTVQFGSAPRVPPSIARQPRSPVGAALENVFGEDLMMALVEQARTLGQNPVFQFAGQFGLGDVAAFTPAGGPPLLRRGRRIPNIRPPKRAMEVLARLFALDRARARIGRIFDQLDLGHKLKSKKGTLDLGAFDEWWRKMKQQTQARESLARSAHGLDPFVDRGANISSAVKAKALRQHGSPFDFNPSLRSASFPGPSPATPAALLQGINRIQRLRELGFKPSVVTPGSLKFGPVEEIPWEEFATFNKAQIRALANTLKARILKRREQ